MNTDLQRAAEWLPFTTIKFIGDKNTFSAN